MATIYIDPSAAVNGTGTLASPFNTWASVSWVAGNAYLQKADTEWNGKVAVSTGGSGEDSRVTLGAYGSGNKPRINGAGFDRCIAVAFGQHYVTIQDLELFGPDTGTRRCVSIGSTNAAVSNFCTVQRCKVHHPVASASADSNGISGFGSNVLIQDNEIYGIPTDGIWFSGPNAQVLRNKIYDVGLDGRLAGDCIQIYGDATLGCGNAQVKGNYCDHRVGSFKQCIIVQDQGTGTGGEVSGNTCLMADYDGVTNNNAIFTEVTGILVRKNKIIGGRYGVFLNKGGSFAIANLIQNADYGVSQTPSATGGVINNNTIASCKFGIYADTDVTVQAKNNLLYRCGVGVSMETGAGEGNNCYYGNTTDRALLGGASSWGTSLFVDPLLSAAYRPLAGSPLISAGIFTEVTQDKNSSTFWTTPTIGAYEYVRPRTTASLRTMRS